MPKAVKPAQLIKLAEAAGWRSRPCGSGHTMLYSPDGVTMVTLASTASDHRSLKNAIGQLRRGGLQI